MNLFLKWAVVFLLLLQCGCASRSALQSNTPIVLPSATPQIVPLPTTSPTLIATPNPEFQRIETEILRLVDKYNATVEKFRQAEGAEIVTDPQTGEERMELSQAAVDQLTPLYDEFTEKIQALDQEYWHLYETEHPYEPMPANLSKAELKQLIVKLRDNEFNTWVESELKSGTTIKYLDPGQKIFVGGLIAESSALYRWKWAYITRLSAFYLAPDQELINLDIQNIQRIEPGEVIYKNRSSNPNYRADFDLTSYETATARYDVYTETHEIIEIVANSPVTDVSGDRAELEKRARELVALISPNWNVDILTFSYNEKVNTYFFRWTDLTKPVLDDGRTYPFIQVGLNGKGELLTYYNTLPLSH